MTTSTITISYPRVSERLIARAGRALVSWADAHAEQAAPSHERHSALIAVERDRVERERRALRLHSFRG